MSYPAFELFRSLSSGQYYFRLRTEDGGLILASKGYPNKEACERDLLAVRLNAGYAERYERKEYMGNYSFLLTSINGQVVGFSQAFLFCSIRDLVIASVMKDAPVAPVNDLT